MRLVIILMCFGIYSTAYAQQDSNQFTYQDKGDTIEYKEYYSNGVLAQIGTIQDGLNHGLWSAFNTQGKKIAEGEYHKGMRVSKWFFWEDESLIEVDFENNKVVKAIRWDNSQILADSQKI